MKACRKLGLPIDPSEWARLIVDWYDGSHRDLPWRSEQDPYRIWLSEIMLQQTQVRTVIPYYRKFVKAYPSLQELAAAEETAVLDLWAGLGYYRRARDLHRAARLIVDRRHGEFPESFSEMIELPGVGRYSAGAVLSLAFGQPYPVLDGNVRRVLIRFLSLAEPPPPAAFWDLLEEVVARPGVADDIASFNQGLMELGALVCTPRNPDCGACPLRAHCLARSAGRENELPTPRGRKAAVRQRFSVALVGEGRRLLMRRIQEGPYLKGFWEPPKVAGWLSAEELRTATETALDLSLVVHRELGSVRHQITFRKLEYRIFEASLNDSSGHGVDFEWVDPGDRRVPVPGWVSKVFNVQRRFQCGEGKE